MLIVKVINFIMKSVTTKVYDCFKRLYKEDLGETPYP